MTNLVHYHKCDGGKPVKEVDGNVYCYGFRDAMYSDMGFDEYDTYDEKCKACPRFYYNNEEKIDKWIKEQEHEKDGQSH